MDQTTHKFESGDRFLNRRNFEKLYGFKSLHWILGLFVGILLLQGCQTTVAEPVPATPVTAAEQSAKPATATFYTDVEGIKEYRLDNGLRVVLLPDSSSENITVNITYMVGSRHEAYGETGMAHLLEHLVFKGTPNHPDIPAELTERGASPNGTTSRDRTNYFETFTATDDNLEWALDLESDRMVNSFIAQEDLDSEMTVVRNEFESGENSPFGVLYKRVLAAAFEWHNYGNSVIGARSDIENVPIERLKAFYKKYYQPDNAVLFIAGKFDVDRALELVVQKFGVIPKPDRSGANQIFETYTAEPTQDGERTVTLRRVGDTQVLMTAYHIPAGYSEDGAAVFVLSQILGSGPSSRLYKSLVETKMATSANVYSDSNYEPGLLLASAFVRPDGDLSAVEDTVQQAISELVESPPTEEEVARILQRYAASTELSLNNVHGMASLLSNISASGDWRLFFIYRDAVAKVTPADVHAVAQKYLIDSNRTTGYYFPVEETPKRAVIEEAPTVASIVDGYQGREAVAAGEEFDATPQNIAARTDFRTLANGTRVAFLVKKTRGETVNASFFMPTGTETSLHGLSSAGQFAGNLLMSGTKNRSKVELRDAFVALKAGGSVSGGLTSLSGGVSTIRDNLAEAIALVAEVAKEPALLQSEFELLKESNLSSLEQLRTDPQALASRKLSRHINGHEYGHANYVPTIEEQTEMVESLTLDEVKSFYDQFYGAGSDAIIVVVGDFDADEIFGVLEKEFGSWNAKSEYERIPSVLFDVDALTADIEVPDKANAVCYANIGFELNQSHEDYPAMMIGNLMLGGGFLNSRLATRIRQKDGLSYGVGSFMSAHPVDMTGSIGGYAIFSPSNADRVRDAFYEEIQKILDDGFTQEELDAAIGGWLDSQKRARANDSTIGSMIESTVRWGRTMDFYVELDNAVANLTLDKVNSVFRKYVKPEKMTFIRAGTFAAAAAGE